MGTGGCACPGVTCNVSRRFTLIFQSAEWQFPSEHFQSEVEYLCERSRKLQPLQFGEGINAEANLLDIWPRRHARDLLNATFVSFECNPASP